MTEGRAIDDVLLFHIVGLVCSWEACENERGARGSCQR